MEETVFEGAEIDVAFFEFASAFSIVDFCALLAFLEVDYVTCPFGDDELRKLDW